MSASATMIIWREHHDLSDEGLGVETTEAIQVEVVGDVHSASPSVGLTTPYIDGGIEARRCDTKEIIELTSREENEAVELLLGDAQDARAEAAFRRRQLREFP
jgi:hypothetical protein